MDELTAERVARNQATFRDANEEIVAAAEKIGVDGSVVPFICECDDETCTEVLLIALAEYTAVRRHPRRFLHSSAHDEHAGSVVEARGHYLVVEKEGLAGEIAERLADD